MTASDPTPGVRKHALDWSQPCLPQAALWLLDRAAQRSLPGLCELDRVLCILPGRRAGRLLLHHLIAQAQGRHEHLAPPRIVTPGQIGAALAAPSAALAAPLERAFAWIAALQLLPAESRERLFPQPPEAENAAAWLDLAQSLVALEDQLQGGNTTWPAAREQAERLELFSEADRWAALEEAAALAQAQLNRHGLVWPVDLHCADSPGFDRVALIGVAELNAAQIAILSGFPGPIDSLVHAPLELLDAAFDDLGCVNAAFWSQHVLSIPEQSIVLVDRPQDQAQALLHELASLGGRYSSAQIAVGVGDEPLAQTLHLSAEFAGVCLRAAHGRPTRLSGPARLLEAAAALLREDRFEHFASLLRHPDLEAWLDRAGADDGDAQTAREHWLTVLDRYFSASLATRLGEPWLGDARAMRLLHSRVQALMEPLSGFDRALAQWTPPILGVLESIYGQADDPTTIQALAALRETLSAIDSAHPDLAPRCSAASAISILLSLTAQEPLASEVGGDQIEMLGWLDLHLDSSPCLIIAGVNDGSIPSSAAGDPFLTDSMRSRLDLATGADRCARDVYFMQAILSSREHVRLITGRRSAEDEPLAPSRLLLSCHDAALPARVAWLCDDRAALSWELPAGLPSPAALSAFVVPAPPPAPPSMDSLRVTDFRDYLACPYRFALRHVIELQTLSDSAAELDPLGFGSLAHDVLCAFGSDPAIRDSADAPAIEEFLRGTLHVLVRRRFGSRPRAAILVQAARLEQRLRGLAQHQAQLAREGWRIQHCEWEFNGANFLEIPGQSPVRILGRIDRIDWHEQSRTWRILDYKSGDKSESPEQKHHPSPRDTSVWEDLQLPLYRHLAAQRGITGRVELGYFILPRDPRDARVITAKWTDDDIARAIAHARTIVADIRGGRFELNLDFDSGFDEFARICQTQVLRDLPAAGAGAAPDSDAEDGR